VRGFEKKREEAAAALEQQRKDVEALRVAAVQSNKVHV